MRKTSNINKGLFGHLGAWAETMEQHFMTPAFDSNLTVPANWAHREVAKALAGQKHPMLKF